MALHANHDAPVNVFHHEPPQANSRLWKFVVPELETTIEVSTMRGVALAHSTTDSKKISPVNLRNHAETSESSTEDACDNGLTRNQPSKAKGESHGSNAAAVTQVETSWS